jgi:hypothetical protein
VRALGLFGGPSACGGRVLSLWRAGPVDRTTLLIRRRRRLRTCPTPPARGTSLPGRAPALAPRSAGATPPGRSSCAGLGRAALRAGAGPAWSDSALLSQRCVGDGLSDPAQRSTLPGRIAGTHRRNSASPGRAGDGRSAAMKGHTHAPRLSLAAARRSSHRLRGARSLLLRRALMLASRRIFSFRGSARAWMRLSGHMLRPPITEEGTR